MADDRQIVAAIDACRPGSNDLDAPEMAQLAKRIREDRRIAALFESLQRWDVKIGAALGDLPVADDLQSRILARLAPPEPIEPTVRAKPTVRQTRRMWASLAIAASVAAALATAWFYTRQTPVTAANLEERVESWRRGIDGGAWQPASATPTGYPASPRVLGRRYGWQKVAPGVVAYDLAGPDKASAVLLVVRVRIDGLPKRPPKRAAWSQNRSWSAWQSDRLLYVLVVDGPPARYQRFLDLRQPPLA